jgi:hypothetical protein
LDIDDIVEPKETKEQKSPVQEQMPKTGPRAQTPIKEQMEEPEQIILPPVDEEKEEEQTDQPQTTSNDAQSDAEDDSVDGSIQDSGGTDVKPSQSKPDQDGTDSDSDSTVTTTRLDEPHIDLEDVVSPEKVPISIGIIPASTRSSDKKLSTDILGVLEKKMPGVKGSIIDDQSTAVDLLLIVLKVGKKSDRLTPKQEGNVERVSKKRPRTAIVLVLIRTGSDNKTQNLNLEKIWKRFYCTFEFDEETFDPRKLANCIISKRDYVMQRRRFIQEVIDPFLSTEIPISPAMAYAYLISLCRIEDIPPSDMAVFEL